MGDNALVTPFQFSLQSGVRKQTNDSQQIQPQALPVTVTKIDQELVTVKVEAQGGFTFPELTIPQNYSQWAREPTQVGDKGYAVPGQYYMGGQSGLGDGVANLYPRGNTSTLVFQPLSQTKFPNNVNRDPNAYFINGPNGAVIQDTGGNCVFTITSKNFTLKDSYGNIIQSEEDKICIIPKDGNTVYVGGDGIIGSYDYVMTSSGPSINTKARFA